MPKPPWLILTNISHQHPLKNPSVGNFEASSLGEKVMFILFPQALQHVSSNITASHVQLLHSIREKEAIVNWKRSSDRVTGIQDQTWPETNAEIEFTLSLEPPIIMVENPPEMKGNDHIGGTYNLHLHQYDLDLTKGQHCNKFR